MGLLCGEASTFSRSGRCNACGASGYHTSLQREDWDVHGQDCTAVQSVCDAAVLAIVSSLEQNFGWRVGSVCMVMHARQSAPVSQQ